MNTLMLCRRSPTTWTNAARVLAWACWVLPAEGKYFSEIHSLNVILPRNLFPLIIHSSVIIMDCRIKQLIFHRFMTNIHYISVESDKIMTCIIRTYHDCPCFSPGLHGGLSGRGLRSYSVHFLSCDCGRAHVSWDPRDSGRGRTGEGWRPFCRESKQFTKYEAITSVMPSALY